MIKTTRAFCCAITNKTMVLFLTSIGHLIDLGLIECFTAVLYRENDWKWFYYHPQTKFGAR